MCNLSDFTPTKKTYKGKLTSINFEYVGDEKVYILNFRSGSVKLFAKSNPWLSANDIIYFTANKIDGEWIIDEIVGKEKKEVAKQTFRTRQVSRLTEAIG